MLCVTINNFVLHLELPTKKKKELNRNIRKSTYCKKKRLKAHFPVRIAILLYSAL